MEKTKKNSGLLVGILIGLIISLIIVLGLFVTGTIRLNDKFKNEVKKENIQEENQIINNKVENELTDDEKFSAVIEEYITAMNDNNYVSNMDKYQYINTTMMFNYHTYDYVTFKYVYFDINKDNKNELIVGNGNYIYQIYSYGDEIKTLINEGCLGERCTAALYDNEIILIAGSSGALVHEVDLYKIASDGSRIDLILGYTIENVDNDNVIITDKITNTIINNTDEDLSSKIIGNAKKIELSNLNWIEIK